MAEFSSVEQKGDAGGQISSHEKSSLSTGDQRRGTWPHVWSGYDPCDSCDGSKGIDHGNGPEALRETGSTLDPDGGAKIVPASVKGSEESLMPVSGSRDEDAANLQALREIVARLQELKSANLELQGVNRDLQDQLEETNRDLSELQFRVDTHSESFRPLEGLFGDPGRSFGIRSVPVRTHHPLLPPKE